MVNLQQPIIRRAGEEESGQIRHRKRTINARTHFGVNQLEGKRDNINSYRFFAARGTIPEERITPSRLSGQQGRKYFVTADAISPLLVLSALPAFVFLLRWWVLLLRRWYGGKATHSQRGYIVLISSLREHCKKCNVDLTKFCQIGIEYRML